MLTPQFNRLQIRQGFTIVELLIAIAIAIIAVLASISIVAYNGIRDRANNSVVRSDAATIAKKLEIAKAQLGSYPRVTADIPQLQLSKAAYDTAWDNVYYCGKGDAVSIGLRSKSGQGYFVVSGRVIESADPVGGNQTAGYVGTTWAECDFRVVGYSNSSSAWREWT